MTTLEFKVEVKPIGCHPGCAVIEGTDHETEINPVDGGPRWRSECPTCATVLAVHLSRDEALLNAILHAVKNEEIHR